MRYVKRIFNRKLILLNPWEMKFGKEKGYTFEVKLQSKNRFACVLAPVVAMD